VLHENNYCVYKVLCFCQFNARFCENPTIAKFISFWIHTYLGLFNLNSYSDIVDFNLLAMEYYISVDIIQQFDLHPKLVCEFSLKLSCFCFDWINNSVKIYLNYITQILYVCFNFISSYAVWNFYSALRCNTNFEHIFILFE
jgi:hypothetical protein